MNTKDVMKKTVTQIQGTEIDTIGITDKSIFIWLKNQDLPIAIFRHDLKGVEE